MPDEKPPAPPIDWKREYMIQAKRNLIALSLLGAAVGGSASVILDAADELCDILKIEKPCYQGDLE